MKGRSSGFFLFGKVKSSVCWTESGVCRRGLMGIFLFSNFRFGNTNPSPSKTRVLPLPKGEGSDSFQSRNIFIELPLKIQNSTSILFLTTISQPVVNLSIVHIAIPFKKCFHIHIRKFLLT